jgi:hypothetical protein
MRSGNVRIFLGLFAVDTAPSLLATEIAGTRQISLYEDGNDRHRTVVGSQNTDAFIGRERLLNLSAAIENAKDRDTLVAARGVGGCLAYELLAISKAQRPAILRFELKPNTLERQVGLPAGSARMFLQSGSDLWPLAQVASYVILKGSLLQRLWKQIVLYSLTSEATKSSDKRKGISHVCGRHQWPLSQRITNFE